MDDELKKRFGNLVAAQRKNRGLTQQGLADATTPPISVNMIGRIETGKTGVSFATIATLAKALNVDEAEFFSTDIPAGAIKSPRLKQITARISKLPEAELQWLEKLISVALEHR